MTKRVEEQLNYFKYEGDPVRLTTGTFLTVILSVLIIVMATFTELQFQHFIIPLDLIPKWSNYFTDNGVNTAGFMKFVKYIPQVPAIFFILGLLDRKYTIITLILYILLGFLGYPIFAMGGGWRYIFQYGVGYILSYIPAVFFSGMILNRDYHIKNVFKAVLTGVIIINIIGALVLLIIAFLRHENWLMIKNLLYSMSAFKFFYDILFSIIAVYCAFLAKTILWPVLTKVDDDKAKKGKKNIII